MPSKLKRKTVLAGTFGRPAEMEEAQRPAAAAPPEPAPEATPIVPPAPQANGHAVSPAVTPAANDVASAASGPTGHAHESINGLTDSTNVSPVEGTASSDEQPSPAPIVSDVVDGEPARVTSVPPATPGTATTSVAVPQPAGAPAAVVETVAPAQTVDATAPAPVAARSPGPVLGTAEEEPSTGRPARPRATKARTAPARRTPATPATPAKAAPGAGMGARSRPGTRGTTTPAEMNWAREAVMASTTTARQRGTRAWTPAPVRILLEVKDLLTERLVADQEATGDYRLAMNHYVSAALSQVPEDVDKAIAWGESYQEFIGLHAAQYHGTKIQVETEVFQSMQRLGARLRGKVGVGLLSYVQTWAVIKLLAALDAEDGHGDEEEALEHLLDRLEDRLAS